MTSGSEIRNEREKTLMNNELNWHQIKIKATTTGKLRDQVVIAHHVYETFYDISFC